MRRDKEDDNSILSVMDENVNTLGNNKYSILIQDGGN
jgi:hypothetical protein